tara:strand:+ start:450 stop:1016 length:567 start_codon:yes stop_codon:yes gene_type:complete
MTKQDGRTLRSVKSQKLIVNAVIKLIKEGNLEPTAQMVADESGIGIRTVFRQFDDMENLLKSVDAELSKGYNFGINIDPNLDINDRLITVINHLNSGYKRHKTIMFMTVSNMWKYKFLQENYMNYQKIIKKKTEEVIPEVLNFDDESKHLFHATLSFALWTRLQGQGLNHDQIKSAMFRQCIMILNQS